jgi:hypothetical protein
MDGSEIEKLFSALNISHAVGQGENDDDGFIKIRLGLDGF